GAYGGLWFSADTGDPEALAYRNRIEQHLSDWQARLLFLELWWQGLDEAEAARLLPEDPDLRHYLHDLRRLREHRLDEARERLILGKDAHGIGALLTVYTLLTSRLEFELEIDGEIRRLSRDALMSHVHAPDPDRRSAAYAELLRVFGREAPVLGQIYVHRVLDWRDEQVRLRGVPSPVTARNPTTAR